LLNFKLSAVPTEIVKKLNTVTPKVPIFVNASFDITSVDPAKLEESGTMEPIPLKNQPLIHTTSSIGPSKNGLMKPDVAATGSWIFSADSKDNTFYDSENSMENSIEFAKKKLNGESSVSREGYGQIKPLYGTSMASPGAGGAAILLEQYFEDGFFPGGKIKPTSSLLRAALVNSAQKIGNTISNAPDFIEGHGQVNLERVMRFEDSEFHSMIGNGTCSLENYFDKIVVKKDGKTPIEVTIAYLDQPASEETFHSLTMDLDLYMISPSGKVYFGNNYPSGINEHFSTIEKIIVPANEVEDGEYMIHIAGAGYNMYAIYAITVDFAMVATMPKAEGQKDFFEFKKMYGEDVISGKFTGVGRDGKETNNLWQDLDCGGRQVEVANEFNGICVCKEPYTGINCQTKIYDVKKSAQEFKIPSAGLGHFSVKVDEGSFLNIRAPDDANYDLYYGLYDFESVSSDFVFENLTGPLVLDLGELAGRKIYFKYHNIDLEDVEIEVSVGEKEPLPTEVTSQVTSEITSVKVTSSIKKEPLNSLLIVANFMAVGLIVVLVILIILMKRRNGFSLEDYSLPGMTADTVDPAHLVP